MFTTQGVHTITCYTITIELCITQYVKHGPGAVCWEDIE